MTRRNERKTVGPSVYPLRGALFGALGLSILANVTSAQEPPDVVRKSSLIFDAEVVQVGSSIMDVVPASPTTMVARVRQVIDKPDPVALSAGQEVVVLFSEAPSATPGTRLRIFGNGRIFAETIAVEAIAAAPVAAETVDVSVEERESEEVKELRRRAAEQALQERLAEASAVVVGEVREVRIPTTEALAREALPRFSEHNPEWREAIIDVEESLKGAEKGRSLVVRFPASEDVMWFDYPKLSVGERGTFILQRDTLTGAETALLAGAEVPAYALTKKADRLPAAEANRIRSLLE